MEYRKATVEEAQIVCDIVQETKALKEYQETPDSKEDMEKIPLLTREDLRRS